MKLEEQYTELKKVKEDADRLLRELDRDKIKELAVAFLKPGSLRKYIVKDNQLLMLNSFCTLWISEQRKLPQLGIDQNIFDGVRSLDDVEEKYVSIKFGVLRLELPMPEEACGEAVDYFIEKRISGIALNYIIKNETLKREQNLVRLARLLMKKGEYETAVVLLREGAEAYDGNREILMELADCWMEGKQWKQALECLQRIRRPGKAVKKLMNELEKAVENESL